VLLSSELWQNYVDSRPIVSINRIKPDFAFFLMASAGIVDTAKTPLPSGKKD
jgi:hypothetical protein